MLLSASLTIHRLSIAAAAALCVMSGHPPTVQSSSAPIRSFQIAEEKNDEQTYYSGLRQRGLFRLAESYLFNRLDQKNIDSQERLQLTLELARTLSGHASSVAPDQGNALWQQAATILLKSIQTNHTTKQHPYLQLELANTYLSEGKQLRWQWEVSPSNDNIASRSQGRFHQALEQLLTLENNIQNQLTQPKNRPVPSLTSGQLRFLYDGIQYAQARCWLNLAHFSDTQSPDFIDHINRAIDHFSPLAKSQATNRLHWSSHIYLIECFQLQGNYKHARQLLKRISQGPLPEHILHRAFAAGARNYIAEGNPEKAHMELTRYRRLLTSTKGEIELVYVEALIAVCLKRVSDHATIPSSETNAIIQTLSDFVKKPANGLQGYWLKRCELLIAHFVNENTSLVDSFFIAHNARSSYRYGHVENARQLYRHAAERAEEQGDMNLAFQYGLLEAGILMKQKQWEQSARRFFLLARQSHPRAAEAHLLGIFSQGEIFRKTGSPTNLNTYEQSLFDHLDQFSDHPTIGDAHWMAGRLRESQKNYRRALSHYRSISSLHKYSDDSILASGRCYDSILETRSAHKNNRGQITAQQAENFYRDVVYPLPAQLTLVQYVSAVRLARLWIRRKPHRFDKAETLLKTILPLSGSDTKSTQNKHADNWNTWKKEANRWYFIALSGNCHFTAARTHLDKISLIPLVSGVDLLEQLRDLNFAPNNAMTEEHVSLQSLLVQRVQTSREQLSSEEQLRFDLLSVEILVQLGHSRRALDQTETLLRLNPKHIPSMQLRARLLLNTGGQSYIRESLQLWRSLEKTTSKTSLEWFNAKLNIAQCHYQLGDITKARKLLEVTQLLHPKLGTPAMKQRFEDLLKQCQNELLKCGTVQRIVHSLDCA